MTFYDRVKDLCDQRGLAITAVIVELGFSKSAGTGWKGSVNLPRASTIKTMADYFGITVEELKKGIDIIDDKKAAEYGVFQIWKAVTLFSVKKKPVVLQELRGDDYAQYCVQYGGSGKYKQHLNEVVAYLDERWSKAFTVEQLTELLTAAPVVDVPNNRYQNYASNINNSNVVQGNTHTPIKIVNGTEHALTVQESELLRILADLSLVEQSKVLVYAAELKEKKGGA